MSLAELVHENKTIGTRAEPITSNIHSNLLILASSSSNPAPAFRLLADRGPGIPLAPIQLPKASRRHKV